MIKRKEAKVVDLLERQKEIYRNLHSLLATDISDSELDLMLHFLEHKELLSLQTQYLLKLHRSLDSLGKDALRVKTV